jgi:hypothetical protein
MDWRVVDVGPLARMHCPSCGGVLDGGLMRQVESAVARCVVAVVCPQCTAECLAILETRSGRIGMPPPLDVDDVLRAHELLWARDWHMNELFAA